MRRRAWAVVVLVVLLGTCAACATDQEPTAVVQGTMPPPIPIPPNTDPGPTTEDVAPPDTRRPDDAVGPREGFEVVPPTLPEHPDSAAFSINVLGGWMLPETYDLKLILYGDGRITMERDGSVFSSTDDYRTLRVDEAGALALQSVVARAAALDPGRSPGVSEEQVVLRIEQYEGANGEAVIDPTLPPAPPPDGTNPITYDDLHRALRDLSWLGDSIIEPEGPWVPPFLGIEAHRGLSPSSGVDPDAPAAPWPLDIPIEDVGGCLEGDDVAPVFALLTGVNHAYLRVEQDGEVWELNVTVGSC